MPVPTCIQGMQINSLMYSYSKRYYKLHVQEFHLKNNVCVSCDVLTRLTRIKADISVLIISRFWSEYSSRIQQYFVILW